MMKSFFMNRKWALWAYGVGAAILVSVYLQVQFTVIINDWYRDFYDLLQIAAEQAARSANGESIPADELRSVDEFWTLIFAPILKPFTFLGFITIPVPAAFMWIALPYVFIATATNFVVRHYGFRWRQAITEDYVPRWRKVDEEIEGASQRIQEDANRFARIIEGLGLAIFRAIMTLIAFLPILWTLSAQVDLPILRDIPGSLVWAALVVTVGGMVISWFVGYFLPGLEYNNQKVEAAFRKELVYGEDDKVNHAKPETLFELFSGVRFNYFRLVPALWLFRSLGQSLWTDHPSDAFAHGRAGHVHRTGDVRAAEPDHQCLQPGRRLVLDHPRQLDHADRAALDLEASARIRDEPRQVRHRQGRGRLRGWSGSRAARLTRDSEI